MYAIILESSPIDLLLGRKKFDLFNQVPSQSRDFDEKTITAVLKLLDSVKLSHDCQPRVALLPTQSITKEFRRLSQVKSPTVFQTRGTVASLVLEVEHLLGVPTPDDDETVHEKGETFAPWLTSDSTVDVLSLINIRGDSNLQENIRTLCTELKDIFSNELPAESAKIEPFNLVVETEKWRVPYNRLPPRPQSVLKQAELVKTLDMLKKGGIIEPSQASH